MATEVEVSEFWKQIITNLREYNDDYYKERGNLLLNVNNSPELKIKPFDSFLAKTYRKNILDNKNWDKPPENGWLLPNIWFSHIPDIVRTTVIVKYIDGVKYLAEHLQNLAGKFSIGCEVIYEARTEGYYAVHIYIPYEFEIPSRTKGTETINTKIEIQIKTQLQDMIGDLLHFHYEEKRLKRKNDEKWQWKFQSDEFTVNYLGHILHYLEAVIVEAREKQRNERRSHHEL